MIDWIMRRLLSLNRAAAAEFFNAPDDGRKWTISALSWSRHHEGNARATKFVEMIDKAFWPGHCQEAFFDTMAVKALETNTFRARRGAVRVIISLLLNPFTKAWS